MDTSIEQLARDLAFASYSERTAKEYVAAARALSDLCQKPIVDLTRDDLRAFVEARAARGKSASRMRTEMCAVRFLFRRTLGRPDLVSFIKLPKVYSPLPTVLSVDEVRALLRAIREPRLQALAMVMYGAGLRLQEALTLEVGDIDGAREVIHVRHGKGNKAREAKLSPVLYRWLRRYWARTRPPMPFLFSSRKNGKRPCVSTVCRGLDRAAKAASIKKHVTAHVLRHSFATHLFDEGYDIHVVRELLGHASIKATVRYVRVTQKRIRATPSPLDLLPQRR